MYRIEIIDVAFITVMVLLLLLPTMYLLYSLDKIKKQINDLKRLIDMFPPRSPSVLSEEESASNLSKKETALRTWIPQENNRPPSQQQAEEAIRLSDKYSLGEGYIKWWLLFYRQRLNVLYVEINELPVLFQNCFPGQYVAMTDGVKEFYGFISPMQRMRYSLNIIFFDGNEKDYALGEDEKYMGYFSTSMDGTIRNDRTPDVELVGIEKFDFSFSTKEISYRTKRVCYIMEKIFWENYDNEHAHQQHYLY